MATESELLPCGCGKTPTFHHWTYDLGGYDGREKRVHVQCSCGMQTKWVLDDVTGIPMISEVWNIAMKK